MGPDRSVASVSGGACRLSLGCGLLLERVAAIRLERPLVLPAGFAVIVVVASFTTATARSAELSVPVVVALALIGVGLALPVRVAALTPTAPAYAAVAAFAALAAPIVLTGHPTIAGYITLDDTPTWLAMTARAMEHGGSIDGLMPSTYRELLNVNLVHGYPMGSMVPFGVAHLVVPKDLAWLFQPYLAFVGAMLALTLYRSRVVSSPPAPGVRP